MPQRVCVTPVLEEEATKYAYFRVYQLLKVPFCCFRARPCSRPTAEQSVQTSAFPLYWTWSQSLHICGEFWAPYPVTIYTNLYCVYVCYIYVLATLTVGTPCRGAVFRGIGMQRCRVGPSKNKLFSSVGLALLLCGQCRTVTLPG